MITFIKFLCIGVLNTLFYYFIYSFFIYSNIHYTIAVLMSTFIAMIVSFKNFGIFVFNNSNNTLFIKFVIVTIIGYFLNITLIYFFKTYGYNDYVSGVFSAIIVAINSFFLNKYFVFKQKCINQKKTMCE